MIIILNVFVYVDIYILEIYCREEYVELRVDKYKAD
jgi:hypothetical protein